jgi:hypothetical protein
VQPHLPHGEQQTMLKLTADHRNGQAEGNDLLEQWKETMADVAKGV